MMPIYSFECSQGHVTDEYFPTRDRRAKLVSCGTCGKKAPYSWQATILGRSVFVIPDFPEHYNISLGCVVKNRKHRQQIMKERGLQDYEHVKDGPLSERMRKEGLL